MTTLCGSQQLNTELELVMTVPRATTFTPGGRGNSWGWWGNKYGVGGNRWGGGGNSWGGR